MIYALSLGDVLIRLFSSALIKVMQIILDILPDFFVPVFEVPLAVTQIINLLTYILPMDTISAIFALTVAITAFRFVLAIVNRIFEVLNVIF